MEEKTNSVIQAIIIVSTILTLVAIFLVAYVIYFNKRKGKLLTENKQIKEQFQQQLLQSSVEVQEHTFHQISKELHDNVGQLLSTARMLLGLTERKLTNPPDTLNTANSTLAQAISELRSLSKSLDKEWLEQFSFIENLKTEINRINTGKVVMAEFDFSGDTPLKSDEQIILFRIVQEAMQNAIKHARPGKICISTLTEKEKFVVSIADDGTGFNPETVLSGQGLRNMKHRVMLLGGTINWSNNPGGGTLVMISLPNKSLTE